MARGPRPATLASNPVPQKAPAEFQGAGDAGAGGHSGTGASGGDAAREPTTPTTAEGAPGVPEPVTPAASDAAGTDVATVAEGAQQPTPPEAEKPSAWPSTLTVKLLSPVDHDGQRYEPGDELTLPLKQAEALVLAGAAGEPDDD